MRFFECIDHGIVESRADLLDRLVRAIGPCAIGQQGDGKIAVGIDPEGSARVSKMAVGVGAEILARLRRGRGSVPAERAGSAQSCVAAGKEGNGFWPDDGRHIFLALARILIRCTLFAGRGTRATLEHCVGEGR